MTFDNNMSHLLYGSYNCGLNKIIFLSSEYVYEDCETMGFYSKNNI